MCLLWIPRPAFSHHFIVSIQRVVGFHLTIFYGYPIKLKCLYSLFGLSPTLSYLFDPSILHLSNKENILLVICHTITAANGSIALWYFVKRAKQCLGLF